MKKQIYILCVLCISSSWLLGMEQQQPRPATVTHEVARAQQQDMVKIRSSHGGKEYELNKHAAALSQVLRTIVEIVEEDTNDPLEFDFADNQIAFIAAVLTYVSRTSVEGQTQEQLAEVIMGIGRQFGLSFVDMLHLANYFDIPLAFNALTSIQPLPLPSPIAAVEYNKALAIVFDMAISTASLSMAPGDRVADALLPEQQRLNRIGSVQLWQLFGRMLYPNCMRYEEVQRMFDTIKTRFDERAANLLLHEIMLGEYMQQHPELYGHQLKILAELADHSNSVAFSPDGNFTAGLSSDSVLLCPLNSALSQQLKKNSFTFPSIAFSPNGKMFVATSFDGTIYFYDVKNGSQIRKITLPSTHDGIYSIAFSPDGGSLAIATDKSITLLNIVSGSLKKFNGHSHFVYSIAFSNDGHTIASASGDNTVRLWNVQTGLLMQTLLGDQGDDSFTYSYKSRLIVPNKGFSKVAISPDGKIVAAGNGKNIRVWDVQTGTLLKTLIGHAHHVRSIAFSPDGKKIASGSLDTKVLLWSTESGSIIQECNCLDGVLSITFSTDSKIIAAGVLDGTIVLWGYRDLFEALQAPLAASSYTYARKRMAPAAQAPVVVAAPSPSIPTQPKSLLAPGFLEKAFADTERRAAEAQKISDDDDELVVLPAPLPEKKK